MECTDHVLVHAISFLFFSFLFFFHFCVEASQVNIKRLALTDLEMLHRADALILLYYDGT
jgi:hypothetical protein